MKKYYQILVMVLSLTMTSCTQIDTNFLITEGSIGPLEKHTKVADLESIFVNDSVVMDTTKFKPGGSLGKIKIFEKTGKHLLTLTSTNDSLPTIENVQVFDSRYKTQKGVGLKSTFYDISKNYKVQKVVTTYNNVVVIPKESNIYFTIDKEELPSTLRYTNQNIEAVQIPDQAKIKFLMIGWD
ncbi:MAG: hypothetical protein HKP24_04475 [Croceitalea sp.]|nr:hypothetical protein [Croceitalea sp.]